MCIATLGCGAATPLCCGPPSSQYQAADPATSPAVHRPHPWCHTIVCLAKGQVAAEPRECRPQTRFGLTTLSYCRSPPVAPAAPCSGLLLPPVVFAFLPALCVPSLDWQCCPPSQFRNVMNHFVFGTEVKRVVQLNHAKAVVVPAGGDTMEVSSPPPCAPGLLCGFTCKE